MNMANNKKKRGISRFGDIPYLDTSLVVGGKVGHRENIEKIKVPAFCHYSLDEGKIKKLGAIIYNGEFYALLDFSEQRKSNISCEVGKQLALEDLIKLYDIDICKAKIILFR